MADITPSSGSIVKPHRSPFGHFPTRTMGVSTGVSSAAIYIGSMVSLDFADAAAQTSVAGFVKRSTGSVGSSNYYIVGFAAGEVSGSSATYGNKLEVWEANPQVEFSAITKGGTIQTSCVGITKKLGWDSTLNINYVDLTASSVTDHRVIITGILSDVGDSGGRVSFRFLQSLTGAIQGTTGLYNSSTPILAFFR